MGKHARTQEYVENQRRPLASSKGPLPESHLEETFKTLYEDHGRRKERQLLRETNHFHTHFPILANPKRGAGNKEHLERLCRRSMAKSGSSSGLERTKKPDDAAQTDEQLQEKLDKAEELLNKEKYD